LESLLSPLAVPPRPSFPRDDFSFFRTVLKYFSSEKFEEGSFSLVLSPLYPKATMPV